MNVNYIVFDNDIQNLSILRLPMGSNFHFFALVKCKSLLSISSKGGFVSLIASEKKTRINDGRRKEEIKSESEYMFFL